MVLTPSQRYSGGQFCRDTSLLKVVPGSQVVSQAVSGVVQLQPSLLYNILLLGPVDGPNLGFTAVQFNFTIYAPGAAGLSHPPKVLPSDALPAVGVVDSSSTGQVQRHTQWQHIGAVSALIPDCGVQSVQQPLLHPRPLTPAPHQQLCRTRR